jgi:amphi-Trp domain-containing protein
MAEERDVEKGYSTEQTVAKLRRLADALETGSPFRIQIAGEKIRVPKRAEFTIEHEREGDQEEVEFQFKWSIEDGDDDGEEEGAVV